MESLELFTVRQAAPYLGVSVATVKYHLKKGNLLPSAKINNSNVFTRAALDAFNANKPRAGWRKGRKRKAAAA